MNEIRTMYIIVCLIITVISETRQMILATGINPYDATGNLANI